MSWTKEDQEYGIYRWKWENFARLRVLEKVPIHLDLELNTDCNYHCNMCPFHSHGQVGNAVMDTVLAKQIIDEFSSKGGSSIKFVYRGEPLLYKPLCEIIGYAKQEGIIETIINSNGMLLTGDKAKDIILSGLDLMVFSVDSTNPVIYRKIRRGGSFNKILKNIFALQALKQYYCTDKPVIRIQGLIQDLNRKEMENGEFENFWKTIVEDVLINPDCYDHEDLEVIDPTPTFVCEKVYQRLTIRVNGDIALCCAIDSDDKILGNIYDGDTIESIWRSDEMNNIRTLIYSGNAHLVPACRGCAIRRKFKNET